MRVDLEWGLMQEQDARRAGPRTLANFWSEGSSIVGSLLTTPSKALIDRTFENLVRGLGSFAYLELPKPQPRQAPTMGDSQLFLDTFTIVDINDVKYDRVSRIIADNEDASTKLTLDINTELYPCAKADRMQLMLVSTLSLDGTRDDGKGWREVGRGEQTLADSWDYVCHGKVYRFEDADEDQM